MAGGLGGPRRPSPRPASVSAPSGDGKGVDPRIAKIYGRSGTKGGVLGSASSGRVPRGWRETGQAPRGGGGRGPGRVSGGVPFMPPGGGNAQFQTSSTPWMKDVMSMYKDLIDQNRTLAGEYNVEDIMSKARAEGSIGMREAEASASRTGGMSSAERRNLMDDQGRNLAGLTGDTERSKLDFEAGLLRDLGGAIGGAGGLAGEEGRFLNQARRNEQDFTRTMMEYPLKVAQMQNNSMNARLSAMASLAGLV